MGIQEQKSAQEVLQVLKQGYYWINENKVRLPLQEELYSRAEIITPSMCAQWQDNQAEVLAGRIEGVGCIKVIEGDCLTVLRNELMTKALVLNFADPRQAGGNFVQGTEGQEQCLCRDSTLSLALSSQAAQEMYQYNGRLASPLAEECMLLAPYVDILRDQDGNFLKHPWRCAVLSASAVDMNRAKDCAKGDIREAMLEKIRHILCLAAALDYDELVLGAWGCGSLGHKAQDVAAYFAQVLVDEDWQKYFRRIVFAVQDNSPQKETLHSFEQILAGREEPALMECVLECRHLDYFRQYRRRLDEIEHFVRGHGKDHPQRVLMLTALIVDAMDLSAESLETIFTAAAFHDAGRIDGSSDPKHGELGAKWYREHYGENKAVEFLIKYHSLDDEQAYKDLPQYHFADEAEIKKLYCILKDADALDRVRFKYFGQGALDKKYLRLPVSRKLLNAAYKLLESDLQK